MKVVISSRHQLFALLAILLIVPSAKAIALSEAEVNQLLNNKNESYIYCDKNSSRIADIIEKVSNLDQNPYSPVKELHDHIQQGFSIARKDAVMETIEYAQAIINAHIADQQIMQEVSTIAQIINNGELDVDTQAVNQLVRSLCDPCDKKNIKIRKKLYVLDTAKFFKNVEFKNDVTFEQNVTIDGALTVTNLTVIDESSLNTLSVNDLTAGALDVSCDVTVGCNLSMNDSISSAIGNVIKNGTPFIHTYPNSAAQNTFVGENAGSFTTSCLVSSAFGNGAMQNANASFDTAIGADALFNDQGSFNTAVGVSVLSANTTGENNTAVGYVALSNNTQGNRNTALGDSTLLANTTGSFNTALGMLALNANTTGTLNVAVGYTSLIGVTAGDNNIGLGAAAGAALTGSDSNNIVIGNVGTAGDNNTIRIGTLQTRNFQAGIRGVTTGVADAVAVLIDSSGQLGTMNSSRRFKHNIVDMDADSANIYKLRPVTFAYNSDATETKQYGLIAEEVDAVFPGIVVKNAEGQVETVQYHVLPVLLLNEVQKLQARVDSMAEDFGARIADLEARA